MTPGYVCLISYMMLMLYANRCLNGGQRLSGKRSRGGRQGGEQDPLADGVDPLLVFGGRGSSGGSSGRRNAGSSDSGAKPPKQRKYIYGSMVVRIRFKDGCEFWHCYGKNSC